MNNLGTPASTQALPPHPAKNIDLHEIAITTERLVKHQKKTIIVYKTSCLENAKVDKGF